MKKTIKYLSMAALAMVGVVITGCSNDDDVIDNPQQPENKVETLTATVTIDGEGDTRALDIDALNKKVVKTFAEGDKIAVVYKNTSGTTVKAESVELAAGDITNEGKSATFTVTLEDADKTKNVTYIYPAAMAKDDGSANYDALATQNGTLASLASNFDYCEYSGAWAGGTSLPTGTMSNQLAICAFTLKDALGTPVTSSVTKMTVSDGTNTYTVTRSAAAGPIYVAIRPTSSKNINYTATDGTKFYAKYVENKSYAAGKMYQLGLKMAEVISGKFSVSSTKQVYFSKGNLRATTSDKGANWTWAFATNQWDKVGNNPGNTTIDNDGTVSSDGTVTVDLFSWSTSGRHLGISNNTTNTDYSSTFIDWGSASEVTATIGTGWRTLTGNEWYYLFITRTTTSGKRFCKAKVNGNFGIILLPDDWEDSYYTKELKNCDETSGRNFADNTINDNNKISLEEWNAYFVPKGVVFLTCAGQRNSGTTVNAPDGQVHYWSSTPTTNSTTSSNHVRADGNGVAPNTGAGRSNGFSVRLVYDIK